MRGWAAIFICGCAPLKRWSDAMAVKAALAVFLAATCAALTGGSAMAADIDALWDYNQPALSEARFREALKTESGDDALELETQIARTFSLRRDFTQAHAALDAAQRRMTDKTRPAVRVRYLLERGRAFRSANEAVKAKPLFLEAWQVADKEKLTLLGIDAAHMMGIIESGDEAQRWNERAMAAALSSNLPRAIRWRGSLANNMGHTERERGQLDAAMKHFQASLTAFQLTRSASQIRTAKWQIANVMRLQKRLDEALAMQLAIEIEAAAVNEPDGYVFEEIAEIYWLKNDAAKAKAYFAKAVETLGKEAGFADNEADRLARMKQLAK
jgi:tetratricopeptide (TPR) repeat protein